MEKVIDSLMNLEEVYERLIELSKVKKDLIIKGKVKELESILLTENALIKEIGKYEEQRENAISKLGTDLNIPGENLTVSHICEALKDPRCNTLKKITIKIGKTLEELKEINELNGKLIEQSLEYIRFSINLITDSLEPDSSTYEAKQTDGKDKKVSLFDAKV